MKIVKLRVKNFRGIDEFERDLVNPLTGKALDTVVFAGPNGSGKTSLLESIVVTLLKPTSDEDKAFSKRMGRDGNEPQIVIEISNDTGNHLLQYPLEETVDNRELIQGISKRIEYFSSWREPRLSGPLGVSLGKKAERTTESEMNRL